MQPREPGTPPLGQLLVDRGVLTSTQLYQITLEQRVTGKPLGEIIMERGLASSDVLKNASDSDTAVAVDSATRAEHPPVQDEKPRGLRERAARRLDEYLAATAADLDERGATLEKRSLALDEEAERLAAAESELARRTRRLRDLDIEDENGSKRIDQLLQVVAGRDAQIAELERSVAHSEAALAAARDQLRDLQAENASLKASCDKAEAILVTLQQSQTTQAEELAHAHQLLDARSQRISELERSLSEAEATLAATQQDRELEAAARKAESVVYRPQTTHVLHVPGNGCYALVERPGPPPELGDRILQDCDGERRFVVTRVGASPLPHDERTCAYLQPA